MKPRKINQKLVLNKKTVCNLERKVMKGLRGGIATIDTCYFTDGCNTEGYCTEVACECSAICTKICPLTLYDCERTDFC